MEAKKKKKKTLIYANKYMYIVVMMLRPETVLEPRVIICWK